MSNDGPLDMSVIQAQGYFGCVRKAETSTLGAASLFDWRREGVVIEGRRVRQGRRESL